ncbi:class I adenylate-forming enzyme family protein [Ammoniphilus resinae]|uniref:Acyl-CoA synthetase (AMP-forming)/AMP-acid ligase II n=1 Tax=Ammoniphilus resinae TaxID=861532 RepID=A0ABS4GVT3_9BACL|nr:class I adenylate-forming enzyme family protein [Ammoniphilus resinae]MBP1934384.1 acyl-CoA synthetase (AMP-forming)/AMP-acid ligase II [Ammoniphilus resinae]
MGTLQYYLRDRAAETPNIEAIISPNARYTYKQFNERTNQLAHYLLQTGIQKGDRIAILCKNNHPNPTIVMAALKIGAVAVPLNWRLTSFELEKTAKVAQPKILFYDEEFSENLSPIHPLIEKVIPVGVGMCLTRNFADIFTQYPVEEPSVAPVTEDDLAFLLFTSGTTGTPKGCMMRHGSWDLFYRQFGKRMGEGLRFLSVHPLFHLSSTSITLGIIYGGQTMVFIEETDPVSILKAIETQKINLMFAFPSVYTYMLEEMKKKKYDLTTLLAVTSGGTQVPSALIKQYVSQGIPMTQGYGSTEATVVSSWHPKMGLDTADSVGKLALHVEVKIIDPETGQPMPPGEVGEVIVKSPYLFKGYFHNPDATRQVLIDGWLHTGDAGRLDEQGFLYISSRYKDVIVYGGDNVYPTEVEEVIHQIEDVLEVAVVGVPHPVMGEAPRAYVIKKGKSSLTEREIIQKCREKLAAYKIPEVVFVTELPKNGLGKILKHVLREQGHLVGV